MASHFLGPAGGFTKKSACESRRRRERYAWKSRNMQATLRRDCVGTALFRTAATCCKTQTVTGNQAVTFQALAHISGGSRRLGVCLQTLPGSLISDGRLPKAGRRLRNWHVSRRELDNAEERRKRAQPHADGPQALLTSPFLVLPA